MIQHISARVLNSGGIPCSSGPCVLRSAHGTTPSTPGHLSVTHRPARHQSAHLASTPDPRCTTFSSRVLTERPRRSGFSARNPGQYLRRSSKLLSSHQHPSVRRGELWDRPAGHRVADAVIKAYLSICFFIASSWQLAEAERRKVKLPHSIRLRGRPRVLRWGEPLKP
jgi:hypothetical protein